MSTAILIILDGLGVGGAPDAESYGDAGCDTLGNMSAHVGNLNIPNLASLGLGNLTTIQNVPPVTSPKASYGRLEEVSAGKDSTTGHWELMGVVTKVAFPTYPNGFPDELVAEFTNLTGYGALGNKTASGTAIIEELGDEHLATKKLIVYTSGDSVFQIAAHNEVCSNDELYRVCEIARKLLKPPHGVGRVIARPFTGISGNYKRTAYRRDYSIDPPKNMLLPILQKNKIEISSIGKIYDLYKGVGIEHSYKSLNNSEGMDKLKSLYNAELNSGSDVDRLILLNLVDFDMLWGHRNDPDGMAIGLEEFDRWLGPFLNSMKKGDLLMMTADHGNDPTMPGTDHSREHVPLLAYLSGSNRGNDIGIRKGFMDVGSTFADYYKCYDPTEGKSFLSKLMD
ncbi:MAG: phosphopentomutase [Gammaproteobacteria bacterium]|nr:phosphopentomutase [Gammaproteobacteria bacterium]